MKVKSLLEQLATCNPEALVVMSSDGEGNVYSPLADFDERHYVADTTWSGWLMAGEDEYDDAEEYKEDLDLSVPAVVLYPTN